MQQFRQLVAAATGVRHTHRYRLLDRVIVQGAAIEHIPLLSCDDDPDYDEDFDGAAAAPECEVGSRILGIDLTLDLVPGSSGGEQMEWLLWKNPDDMIVLSGVTPAALFTNDTTTTIILMRKYVLAYGRFLSTASKESSRTHVQISRAAMKRAGVMHDQDKLYLGVTHTASASNGTLSMHGRIWTRK